jgi:glycerol uptake facilitator-like aquaporin
MFELPLVQSSLHARTGVSQWLAEAVATCGLVLVVIGHRRPQDGSWLVAAWIGAAYWFTSSTAFANPAISIARGLSDTFAGIRPVDVPAFIVAQCAGALIGLVIGSVLFVRADASAPATSAQPDLNTSRIP